MRIQSLELKHWESVKKIYEQGIATNNATFQSEAPSWKEWDDSHLQHSRIVGIIDNEVVGWAALTLVSGRCVYAGVAEVSVYVNNLFSGKGYGKKILESLVVISELNNIWTLTAGIFPENKASVSIHEKCGFKILGTREKIGQMNGQWRDVLLLERRSKTVGI